MTLRTHRERLLQSLAFEAAGIVLAVPLFRAVSGAGAQESAQMLGVLTCAVLIWSALHNAAFDWVEHRLTGRLASDRRAGWRMVHAVSHEVSAVAVTLPIMLVVGGHSLATALTMNIALTLFYTVYAFVFHLIYDRLRPVRRLTFVSSRKGYPTCEIAVKA